MKFINFAAIIITTIMTIGSKNKVELRGREAKSSFTSKV